MEKLHSVIGASSAKRWFNCPGSVREIAKYPPPPPSEYALEGTLAHEFAENRLKKTPALELTFPDEEMREAVQLYVDTVRADQELLGGELLIESEFELHHLHPNLWGTNDCALITDAGVIIVYDFKYGKGIVVEVADNEQLMIYALGAIKKIGRDFDTIEIVIVQPRAPHEDGRVRRQVFYKDQLIEFAKLLKKKAEATDDPKAKLKAGEWCKFCAAQPGCPALKKHIESTAMVAFDELPTVPNPADLSQDALVKILRAIPMFDDWINAVKSFALEKAKRGEHIPGFKLVQGKTHRKWIDPTAVMDALDAKGIDTSVYLTEPELKSPALIEKLTALGKPAERRAFVEPLTMKPEGALNLVPEEDYRPALDSNAGAAAAFGDNI